MPNRRIIKVLIEDIAPIGSGVAVYNNPAIQVINRTVMVWGAYPGETAEVEIFKHDGGKWFGVALKILESSIKREEPRDSIYLSSSPWQGITIDEELRFKRDIIRKVFTPLDEVSKYLQGDFEIVHDDHIYGYRNKMEYHLFEDDGQYGAAGKIIPTIFGRREKNRVPIPTNSLVVPGLHECIQMIVTDINKTFNVGRTLKTIIIRSVDQVGLALFVKDMEVAVMLSAAMSAPANEKEQKFSDTYKHCLSIYYSKPESPASVADKLLFEPQNPALTATLNGVTFEFGPLSFFQVNLTMAEKLLTYLSSKIAEYMSSLDIKKEFKILDYYSGVGTIGIACMVALKNDTRISKEQLENVYLMLFEENSEASMYAKKNVKRLQLEGQVEINCGDSLGFKDSIQSADLLIVDPPRGGLHPVFLKTLVNQGPEFLVYQSCNIESQARDVSSLVAVYEVVDVTFYNFFPRTPHIESLMIMRRKGM